MKKYSGYLIGIVLLIISLGQVKAQCNCIPDSVLTNVVDELIIKDGYVFELNKKDSIITVYTEKELKKDAQIAELKLNEADYLLVIENKDRIFDIAVAQIEGLKKEIKKLRRQKIILTVVIIAEGILTLLIATR